METQMIEINDITYCLIERDENNYHKSLYDTTSHHDYQLAIQELSNINENYKQYHNLVDFVDEYKSQKLKHNI